MVNDEGDRRFGAVDVHYPAAGGAQAALVVAADRRFRHIVAEHVRSFPVAAAYEAGRFYLRELAPIRAVILDAEPLTLVVIDGYVDLDPLGRPGLGAHLHAETGLPVVGVAKSAFRTATHARLVRRGTARRPLFVTALGVPIEEAAGMVAEMAGAYRIPDALRRVDRLAATRRHDD
jgi:deoxyribonuclease V